MPGGFNLQNYLLAQVSSPWHDTCAPSQEAPVWRHVMGFSVVLTLSLSMVSGLSVWPRTQDLSIYWPSC